MAVRLITQAFGLDLECRLKFVAVALADCADDEHEELWPSVAFLAWKTNQSARQVKRALRYFREAGALVPLDRERGGRRRSTVYRLQLDVLPKAEPFARTRRGISPMEDKRKKG